ncbi:MAG: DUF2782 domain-containing protein [Marinicella sp.]
MKQNLIFGLAVLLISNLLMAQSQNDIKPADDESSNERNSELLDQLTQPADDATSVKVIVQKKQTIEEYRQRGELVLVKVIPNEGVPYFIDPLERDKLQGSGRDLINSGVKPVRWVLKEF